MFDGITYEKGGAVLSMLESYVGPEVFRKGVNAYLRAHANGNATSADFWQAEAQVSGQTGRSGNAHVRAPAGCAHVDGYQLL